MNERIRTGGESGDRQDETSVHVHRARGGDAESVAWLVERLTPLLLAQARYRLTPVVARYVDAEDLVQETWAVALPALGRLVPRSDRMTPTLLRYLSTTLLHRLANATRRCARARAELEVGEPAVGVEELPEATAGVVTRTARSEAARRLTRAIDELPSRDRDVVVQRGIEQHPNHLVAERLGESANAVSLRFSRAVRKLREQLAADVPTEVLDELLPEKSRNA